MVLSKSNQSKPALLVLGIFAMAFSVSLSNCSEAPAPSAKLKQKLYFDLKGYFDAEVQKHAGISKVKKIVSVNGEKEERILDSLDLKRELGIFSDADINRAAWSDKYKTDSIFNDQKELVQLHYSAIDKKLKTRKISIDFKAGEVAKIFIENSTSSALADTRQTLTYQPLQGYSIESHQKVLLTSDNTFFVEVGFLGK